jgi:hypothetical protein
MPRARMLKPGFFKNEELASLPFEARLCYAGLWTIADRVGRLPDKPLRIKAEIFPYDTLDVEPLLQRLHEQHFITRYSANGDGYIAIPTWDAHQHPHPKAPESHIPPQPRQAGGRTVAGHGPVSGRQVAGNGSTTEETVNGRAESFPSESCTSGSSGSSESELPSAALRAASPLAREGRAPLKGSRRLKKNLEAGKRAAAHIRARSQR